MGTTEERHNMTYKIVFIYLLYIIMKEEKTFKKISETSFQLDEVKEFSNTVDCVTVFQQLTAGVNQIKQVIGQAKTGKDQVKQIITWYNAWVDVLVEANDKLHLAIIIPAKIDLGDDYDVASIDIAKLPKIDIKKPEAPVVPLADDIAVEFDLLEEETK